MRLLEGEDPLTEDGIAARHWQDIYARLISFTDRRIDCQGHDHDLDDRLDRYAARRMFWLQRRWELEKLSIDEEGRAVAHHGASIKFTRREFQIIKLLLECAGEAFSSQRLLTVAWSNAELPEEAVRSYIGRIRRKLLDLNLAVIHTDPKDGYRLEFKSGGGYASAPFQTLAAAHAGRSSDGVSGATGRSSGAQRSRAAHAS